MRNSPVLSFRDFRTADLPVLAQAMGDAQVTQYYGLETSHDNPEAIAREQLDWYRAQAQAGEGWWQALCSDAVVVGAVGVYDRDDDGDSAELGYWLLPGQWGRGTMRAALAQWLPSAFSRLALHSIVAYVEPDNAASAKLLTHSGFVLEGLLRDCTKRGNAYVSLQRYSLLASELPNFKQ